MIRPMARSSQGTTRSVDRRLLVRYRVMAFTTAVLLLVLVFVGLPLQLAARRPGVVNVVGTAHGVLYIVYLFTAFELTRNLGVRKWQMLLVLLAGTVPFAAFVAERKLTRRVAALDTGAAPPAGASARATMAASAARARKRWLSGRALVLHLEVAIIAPGCVAAGWWQATRALGGNELSWFYSVEWPVFALLAVGGWWYLIHEDPEVYRARRRRSPAADDDPGGAVATRPAPHGMWLTVGARTARMAKTIAVLVGLECALGFVALALVPADRPVAKLTAGASAIYGAHAAVGFVLGLGAVMLLARVRGSTRLSRLSGWIGATGVAIADVGGMFTVDSGLRLAGMALMLVGPIVAGFGYLIPTFEKLEPAPLARDG